MNVFNFVHKYDTHNECDLLIKPDGTVIPVKSHIDGLVEIYCKKYSISNNIALNKLSITPYGITSFDYLINDSHCVAVWKDHIVEPETLSSFQKQTLDILTKYHCIDIKNISTIDIPMMNNYGECYYSYW